MNVPFLRSTATAYAQAAIGWYLGLSQSTAGRLTDLNAGSNLRSLLETWAIQLEQLDTKAFVALERAMPTVLYEFLGEGDGVTTTVGFPGLPALAAIGPVRFTRRPGVVGDIPIPLGTRLAIPGTVNTSERLYTTIVPALMAATATAVDSIAQAGVAGTVGNCPAGSLQFKDFGPSPDPLALGILTATNPAAFLSGAPAETDEGRRLRFAAYFRSLARSQHLGLEVGARRAQQVVAGVVTERVLFARSTNVPGKRGLADVYLDNGGGGASTALVAIAQTILDGSTAPDGSPIPGYKAAGVDVRAKAVVPQIVDIRYALAVDPGEDFTTIRTAVDAAIGGHLFGLGVFANLILSELTFTIQGVRGVYDVEILEPTANVTTATGARILPGTITASRL